MKAYVVFVVGMVFSFLCGTVQGMDLERERARRELLTKLRRGPVAPPDKPEV